MRTIRADEVQRGDMIAVADGTSWTITPVIRKVVDVRRGPTADVLVSVEDGNLISDLRPFEPNEKVEVE